MANIKSAKKRIVQTLKKTEFNRFRKSKIRSGIKKIYTLLDKKDPKEINKNFLVVESQLAKAVGKGVYKKNTASRLISRLSKKNKICWLIFFFPLLIQNFLLVNL